MHNRFAYHLHSDMSNIRIIDAINKPEEVIQYALKIGLKGICFCEHEHLGNSIILDRLKDKYKEKYPEFKIAHGNEIYLTNDRSLGQKYYHFILIAKHQINDKIHPTDKQGIAIGRGLFRTHRWRKVRTAMGRHTG